LHLLGIHRAGLLRQLEPVQLPGHCDAKAFGMSEVFGQMTSSPTLDLRQERLLPPLARADPFDEDEDRLGFSSLPILLLGCGVAQFLRGSVSRTHEQNDDVGLADAIETGSLRGSGQGAEVLGSNYLVPQRPNRSVDCVSERFMPSDDGTDEDPHAPFPNAI
jgi:hypothetical protein